MGIATRVARRLARNRLVQFAALGGVLFAVAPAPAPRDVISVRRQTLGALAAADTSRKTRLTADRAREIEQRYLEDEILYREGIRLGLDKRDGIVRQRVVQKVLFLAEELGGASRPATDAELRAFHAAHAERFVRPTRIRLRHVFARTLALLPDAPPGAEPVGGQASPIGPELDAELPRIEQMMGAELARAVAALTPGTWSAPLRSAFGWHRVRVIARTEARPATFAEARAGLVEQLSIQRRQEAIQRFLRRAFARYRVDIDGAPATALSPSLRLAARSAPSAED